MKIDPTLKWKLRLVDPADDIAWQAQYTGHDPSLELPKEIDEKFAKDFLLASARFADRAIDLNANQESGIPADRAYLFLKKVSESHRSNHLIGTLKRANFNTNILNNYHGHLLYFMHDYLFLCSDSFKQKLPVIPLYYGGTKAEQKMQRNKVNAVKAPFKKSDSESWEEYTTRFLSYCDAEPDISALGLMEKMADSIKIQYVEPWLLYRGQTIDELADALGLHNAPESSKEYVAQLKRAYSDSGLEKLVDTMRELASSPEAQQQIRAKVRVASPKCKIIGYVWCGGVLDGKEEVVERI